MGGLVMVFGDRLPRSLRRMRARDIMSRGGVVKVSGVERVDRVEALLRDTTHNAFPVVDVPLTWKRRRSALLRSTSLGREVTEEVAAAADGGGGVGGAVYLGLIQRRHLVHSLQRQHFITPEQATEATLSRDGRSREVSVASRLAFSPTITALRTQSVSSWLSFPFSVALPQSSPPLSSPSTTESPAYVSLLPYIDAGAYMVSEEMTARRVWSLFRSLGMRHIVVVDTRHLPIGMITRRDLIMHAVADR